MKILISLPQVVVDSVMTACSYEEYAVAHQYTRHEDGPVQSVVLRQLVVWRVVCQEFQRSSPHQGAPHPVDCLVRESRC